MIEQSLAKASWNVRAVGEVGQVPAAIRDKDIPATVPGCVHTDLLAAKLIPDPYLDRNDLDLTWIGQTDWQYTACFDVSDELLGHDRVELVCDGLDTVALLSLNGREIGQTESMHIAHRFDVRDALQSGENTLVIRFRSPIAYAEAQRDRLGELISTGQGANPRMPHNFIRKMACNFGWDWGPPLVTAGVWRPIRLAAWSNSRFDVIRPLIREANKKQANVEVCINTEAANDDGSEMDLGYELLDPDGKRIACESLSAIAGETASAIISVNKPRLWWPLGHGDQPLYTLRVTLKDAASQVVQQVTHRIGLREVELVTTPDEQAWGEPIPDGQGATFHLKINGKRIYCKGANWIPDDCFPHRVTPARYRERIAQAHDANMNMLRVWGGGLYESHDFYDVCDELGVMVWQDFLFACALYPEEQPFRTLVETEARQNIARLSRHASLVLWNGCNENIWGTFNWGDKWRLVREEGKRTWGGGYYLDLLPKLVDEVDGSRPYWPGSPYSGSMELQPNANEYGNRHIWSVWHGKGNYRNYLNHYPRMCSEFGYHAPPSWATLTRAIPEDQRRWDSETMKHHNKNGRPGQEQTNTRMGDDFEAPAPEGNFDDWHYLAQVMQARALDMGVSWFRALSPWNSGALYWQLNDCWPVSSWSSIDGDGRRKPMWYASRRFFAPRLVTIKPRRVVPDGEPVGLLAVYLHNDSDTPWTGKLRLRQASLAGETVNETLESIKVAPGDVARVLVPAGYHDRPDDTMLVADVGAHRATWFFQPDKLLAYPEPAFEASLDRRGDVYWLTLTATAMLRDLCIFPDRLDPEATIDEQFVTLLPGESRTFQIRSSRQLDADALTTPPVCQCVNRFGRADATAPVDELTQEGV